MPDKSYAHRALIDKLGIKPGARVSILAVDDGNFMAELIDRTGDISLGGVSPASDAVFLGVEQPDDMAPMAALRSVIKPAGAVWVVYRKGRKDFNENDVLRLGLETGLVDVKVVRFSDTHTATKFVIRKAERPKQNDHP
jgi:hypothetical protein